jgi:hypothetical protein
MSPIWHSFEGRLRISRYTDLHGGKGGSRGGLTVRKMSVSDPIGSCGLS